MKDESPARAQERHESAWRTIHREHARTGRPLQGPYVKPPRASSLLALTAQIQALAARLQRLTEEQAAGAALNVRLYERERDQGMGF